MIHIRSACAIALLCVAPATYAADSGANALRDARSLASCMKALDTECTLKWMYTKNLEQQGNDLASLRAELNVSFENIRYAQGKTEQFELGMPGAPFAGDAKQYIFIPYQETMNVQGQMYSQTAYFIGVSEDEGLSWKFVDGTGFTEKNIREIIPSYAGGPLPPTRSDPPAGK